MIIYLILLREQESILNVCIRQAVNVMPYLFAQIFIQPQVKLNARLINLDAYIIVVSVMLQLLLVLVQHPSQLELQQIVKNLFIVEVSEKLLIIVALIRQIINAYWLLMQLVLI